MSTTQTAVADTPLVGVDPAPAASQVSEQATAAASSAGEPLGNAFNTIGQPDVLFAWGSYFQALAILFLIIAVLFAALWILKRKGRLKLLTRQGDLALESRLALGPKKSLIVVRFLNKRVLLGVTDQQITMLTELPTDEDETPQTATNTADCADFNALLTRAEQGTTESSG